MTSFGYNTLGFGSFTSRGISIQSLVIAGGAGGGGRNGGGGGAGNGGGAGAGADEDSASAIYNI